MTHLTEIVGYKKLSDEQFSVLIRCCGNASTDHWHTMTFVADQSQREINLNLERDKVAARHQAAVEGEGVAIALMGHTQDHDV